MASEYKGYKITHRKDGSFEIEPKVLTYALANGGTKSDRIMEKTLEAVHAEVDAFISSCEEKDKEYHDKLADLSKQITEMHNKVTSGIKSIEEKTVEALHNAIKCGELLCKAKDILAKGKWGVWVAANCQGLSARTESRYRKLFKKFGDLSHVTEMPKSIRQAYIQCGLVEAASQETSSADTEGEERENDNAGEGNNIFDGKGDDVSVSLDDPRLTSKDFTVKELVEMLITNLNNLEDDAKRNAVEELQPLLEWHKENNWAKSKKKKSRSVEMSFAE